MASRFRAVRAHTLALARPLSAEDQCVQSMPDASPTKWHLAHTSWFFETVVLQAFQAGYTVCDPQYLYLFNSYYEALGPRHPRPQRGLLTRPALADVHAYRQHVNTAMLRFMETAAAAHWQAAASLVELGLHHEEQHQELLLTDMLHLLSCNPLLPQYLPKTTGPVPGQDPSSLQWLAIEGGIHSIGHAEDGFAFDNETPRHQVLLQPFQMAQRLVTCGEYLDFMTDGGYANAAWWLSDGWAMVQSLNLCAPAYWLAPDDPRAPSDHWQVFGLHGVLPLDRQAPVTHVSFFEAAAFAEWSGARLPTEFEWEAAFDAPAITQMLGQGWQWTRSAYEPYPGFRPRSGAVREYNGKFMVGQQILRGSSAATPEGHSRKTYRNFFPASARWQFAGIRLAKDNTI
ncbi:MAG: ergothioneine biosynthesis protein EgtB [Pseudomonadota bacterium]